MPTTVVSDSLNEGLRAIIGTEFPRRCPECHVIYLTAEQFLKETATVERPVGESLSEGEAKQFGIERQCSCGAVISVFCTDRRDWSQAGIERRYLFGMLLDRMEEQGLDREVIRRELLEVLLGRSSQMLNDLGLRFDLIFPHWEEPTSV